MVEKAEAPMSHKEDLWEAYSAGAERSTGQEVGDLIRDDFEAWYQGIGDQLDMMELDLPVRMHNALARMGVRTVGQVRQWLTPGANPDGDIWVHPDFIPALDIRGVGVGLVKQAQEALRRFEES